VCHWLAQHDKNPFDLLYWEYELPANSDVKGNPRERQAAKSCMQRPNRLTCIPNTYRAVASDGAYATVEHPVPGVGSPNAVRPGGWLLTTPERRRIEEAMFPMLWTSLSGQCHVVYTAELWYPDSCTDSTDCLSCTSPVVDRFCVKSSSPRCLEPGSPSTAWCALVASRSPTPEAALTQNYVFD